jgi:hypothetical protein
LTPRSKIRFFADLLIFGEISEDLNFESAMNHRIIFNLIDNNISLALSAVELVEIILLENLESRAQVSRYF